MAASKPKATCKQALFNAMMWCEIADRSMHLAGNDTKWFVVVMNVLIDFYYSVDEGPIASASDVFDSREKFDARLNQAREAEIEDFFMRGGE